MSMEPYEPAEGVLVVGLVILAVGVVGLFVSLCLVELADWLL